MGFDKAATPLAGSSPLERLGTMLAGKPVAVVTTQARRTTCVAAIPDATVLVNDNPALGMSSSLLVAHRAIDADATLGVLLADKPFVRRETLESCERAYAAAQECDVLFPEVLGEPGHPVYFGPNARARLEALPPGDTLQAVRNDPELKAVAVHCNDRGILLDLDTPEAWRVAERRLSGA